MRSQDQHLRSARGVGCRSPFRVILSIGATARLKRGVWPRRLPIPEPNSRCLILLRNTTKWPSERKYADKIAIISRPPHAPSGVTEQNYSIYSEAQKQNADHIQNNSCRSIEAGIRGQNFSLDPHHFFAVIQPFAQAERQHSKTSGCEADFFHCECGYRCGGAHRHSYVPPAAQVQGL